MNLTMKPSKTLSLLALMAALASMPFLLVGCGSGGKQGNSSPTMPPISRPLPEVPGAGGTGEQPPSTPVPGENPPAIAPESTSYYFSYDESGSTASRDLTLAALANNETPEKSWGRPYEYLNAESFDHFDMANSEPFNISMGLYKAKVDELPLDRTVKGSLYALGIIVSGPVLLNSERKNVVLTLLVDISGSMSTKYSSRAKGEITTRLDVVKEGLFSLLTSLKEGDVLSLVTFETQAKTVVSDWVFQEDDNSFFNAVASLKTNGSTNLDKGIDEAYRMANMNFDPAKSNRVIILTDAYANSGQIDPAIIASSTVINGLEGIYFSGIGIGGDFNDRFLNELTDIGKGTYSAMITPNDAERIFVKEFMRFLSPAVHNVKFKLAYPQALNQFYSAAEDISENEEDVSEINFSYNSEQFFLELFEGSGILDPELTFTFTATFTSDGEPQEVSITKTLGELLAVGEDEIKSAVEVTTLAQLVAGNITCADIRGSTLYNQDIRTYTFVEYKQAVKDYCGNLNF